MRILFISANPHWEAQLDLNEEMRLLMAAIKGQDVELLLLPAAQYLEVEAALEHEQTDIVHFSGHATEEEGILLRNSAGETIPLGHSDLCKMLDRSEDKRVKLVVLNACTTKSAAAAIEGKVDAVIATYDLLDDSAGKAFTKYFYAALVGKASIQDARDAAIRSLEKSDLESVYTEVMGAPDGVNAKPFENVKRVEREHINSETLRSWETYFYLSYLDDQIDMEKRWIFFSWIKFGVLLALGLVFAITITEGSWTADLFSLEFLSELTGNVLKGGPIPAVFAMLQQRLVAHGNDRLQSLRSLRSLVDSSEELNEEVKATLHSLLDHSLRGSTAT